MLVGVIAEQSLLPYGVRPPLWYDSPLGQFAQLIQQPDQIYQARSTIVGFVMPDLVDETAPLLGGETIGGTYVTQDYQGIFPDQLAHDDTFHDFTRSTHPVLAPAMWYDADFYLRPNVGTDTLSISFPSGRFTDTDLIFSPSFSQGIAPAPFVDDDIIRAQVIRRDTDGFVLLTAEFNDVDIVFVPTLAGGLLPSLVTDADAFYSFSQGNYLLPSLFAADDVFYAPLPANDLRPSSVLDLDVFIGPEFRQPGNMELVVDDDIMRSPTVGFGPLSASWVDDTDVFITAVVGDMPPLVSAYPDLIDFEDTFFAPAISFDSSLAPHAWTDVDDIRSVPSVAMGQGAAPGLFDDASIFFTPVFTQTTVLAPASVGSDDAFHAPLIYNETQILTANLATDGDTFQAPMITQQVMTHLLSGSRAGLGSVAASDPSAGSSQIISNVGAVTP